MVLAKRYTNVRFTTTSGHGTGPSNKAVSRRFSGIKPTTITLAVLAVTGALAAYIWQNHGLTLIGQAQSADAQTLAAAPKPDSGAKRARSTQTASVKVVTAVAGDLPVQRQTIGAVVAQNSTALSSPAAGLVESIKATQGTEVKAGDVIVKLDDRSIRATVAKDQDQMAKDTAALNDATLNYDSTQSLVTKGDASKQAGDDAQAVIREDHASIDLDKAQIAVDQVALANTTIQAPFDGQLGAFQVSPGAFVAAGAQVVTLTQMKPLCVEFALPQSDLAAVRTAMAMATKTLKLSVVGAASGGKPADTSYPVVFMDNAVDGPSGTFKMRALLTNGDQSF